MTKVGMLHQDYPKSHKKTEVVIHDELMSWLVYHTCACDGSSVYDLVENSLHWALKLSPLYGR